MPKVSVCILTHNRVDYHTYSINRVLNQNYANFEVIIGNDGSTDSTSEVVSQFNNSRIRYI